jgi:glucose/arabinose dehydrogenase
VARSDWCVRASGGDAGGGRSRSASRWQGGLLDLTLHPDFSSNGLIYFSYSKALEGGLTTAVARARWDGEALRELEDIFVADAAAGEGRHFGSRLLFDRERRLWVTVGDRGLGDPSQDLSNHMGTTLRLHDDGSVPADNPFVGEDGARPEIYSYGHRNAQGLALHPGTGEVWLHEHGPRGGDAVQRVLAGRNYGWPEVSFGREYTFLPIPDPEPGQGFELPLHHWTPSIAPSGMTFYIGSRFPAWRGDVFAGALAGRHLRRVVFDGLEPIHEEVLLEGAGRADPGRPYWSGRVPLHPYRQRRWGAWEVGAGGVRLRVGVASRGLGSEDSTRDEGHPHRETRSPLVAREAVPPAQVHLHSRLLEVGADSHLELALVRAFTEGLTDDGEPLVQSQI